MIKIIEFNNKLRVNITKEGCTYLKMEVQKRYLLFWIATGFKIYLSEGFWGEENYSKNPMINHDNRGTAHETYKTGTFKIKERAELLCNEYLEEKLSELKLESYLK